MSGDVVEWRYACVGMWMKGDVYDPPHRHPSHPPHPASRPSASSPPPRLTSIRLTPPTPPHLHSFGYVLGVCAGGGCWGCDAHGQADEVARMVVMQQVRVGGEHGGAPGVRWG